MYAVCCMYRLYSHMSKCALLLPSLLPMLMTIVIMCATVRVRFYNLFMLSKHCAVNLILIDFAGRNSNRKTIVTF